MSIENPIGGRPKDPHERYEWAIQQELERGSGGGPAGEPPGKKILLLAMLLRIIRKMVDFVLKTGREKVANTLEDRLQENLELLQGLFEALKQEDRSEDVLFLNQLSELWHQLLEDGLQIEKHSSLSPPFQEFLKELYRYPSGEEHSFGYYLTEYTGHAWLPFPYLDLVRRIHREYQEHPSASAIERWTQRLDALLAILASGQ